MGVLWLTSSLSSSLFCCSTPRLINNMALFIAAAIIFIAVGSSLGHLLVGVDVSVTAVLNISLIRILVRNGDYHARLMPRARQALVHRVFDAALQAGKRRMRPIFLTSAAVFSMGGIPMILGKSSCGCLWYGHFLWNADFHGISGNGITGSLPGCCSAKADRKVGETYALTV